MKYFNRIFMVIIGIMVIFILGTNYILLHILENDSVSREYRVEMNRLAGEIEENGLEGIDLSQYHYVTAVLKDTSYIDRSKEKVIKKRIAEKSNIEKNDIEEQKIREQDFIIAGDSEYMIKEIGDNYYRFEYKIGTVKVSQSIIVIINFVFAIFFLLAIMLMLFIKHKILSPFFTLRELPFELSKGNLAMPIKENKSRFFGALYGGWICFGKI